MGTSPRTMSVYVELGHHLDASAWTLAHAAGEVPNRLPFGLEVLEEEGLRLRFRPQWGGHRPERWAGRLNRTMAGLEWVETALLSQRAARRASDVVLGWDEWTGVPAAWRSRLPSEPPVVCGIMNLTDWPALQARERRVLGAGMAASRALFQHSGAQADLLVADWGVPHEKITLIPFGVDAEFFRPQPVPVDRDLIVSVGDDAHRDYPGLFRAVDLVRARRPSTHLFAATTTRDVADAGPHVDICRRKLGPRRPRVYSSAAVVAVACHPQTHGSGLSVIVEAMACGRPWVATGSVGFAEHLDDGAGGLLVPPHDPEAFAAALTYLLEHPDEADDLGRRGRDLVERRLNTTAQNRVLADLVRSCAAESAGSTG